MRPISCYHGLKEKGGSEVLSYCLAIIHYICGNNRRAAAMRRNWLRQSLTKAKLLVNDDCSNSFSRERVFSIIVTYNLI